MGSTLELFRERLGESHAQVASALNNLALELLELRREPEALTAARQSAAIRQERLGPFNPELADALITQSQALESMARHEDALALRRRALEISEKALGPDHPNVARDLTYCGRSLLALGRAGEARPLLERAWKLRERDDVAVGFRAQTEFALARALWTEGERSRSCVLARRARDILSRETGQARSTVDEVHAWWVRREHRCRDVP